MELDHEFQHWIADLPLGLFIRLEQQWQREKAFGTEAIRDMHEQLDEFISRTQGKGALHLITNAYAFDLKFKPNRLHKGEQGITGKFSFAEFAELPEEVQQAAKDIFEELGTQIDPTKQPKPITDTEIENFSNGLRNIFKKRKDTDGSKS